MNIKTQDLRLGNLISFKALNPVDVEIEYKGKVTSIREDSVTMNDALHVPEQFILPVILTEEWLEEAGFRRDEGRFTYKLTIAYEDSNYPCTLQQSGSGIQICRSGIGAACPNIEYVHQLQNLYFALVGEELEINI